MEVAIIFSLIGLGFGFHFFARVPRKELKKTQTSLLDAESKNAALSAINEKLKNENEALHNKNSALNLEVEGWKLSEKQRLEDAERKKQNAIENDITDSENQRKFISQCKLYSTRPVNPEAFRIMASIEDWIRETNNLWRVSFEVSMGAFIKTDKSVAAWLADKAFRSYNSKRVDFLIINEKGYPKAVVEYNGSGHDLSDDAEDRMEVKRLALEKAKIALIQIEHGAKKQEILGVLEECLGRKKSSFQPVVSD